MRNLVGMQWIDAAECEKNDLLSIAKSKTKELGECIVDFAKYGFSIKGLLLSDGLIIADDSIFYISKN